MDRRFAVTVFIVFLFATFIVGNSVGQTGSVIVGVSAGNSFKYDLTFLYSSVSGQAPPSYLVEENQTDYFLVTVQMVGGTTVVSQTSWRFMNGTVLNNTDIADVSGYNENFSSSLVYAANLTSGDKLFPLAPDLPWVINSSQFRTYGGVFRLTNYIEVNRTDLPGEAYSDLSSYIDKDTGMMVELTSSDVYTAFPDAVFTRHLVLKESNVWVIPEFPSLIALPLLISSIAAAALVFKKKRLLA